VDIANICGINNRTTEIHSKFETRSRYKEKGREERGRYAHRKFLKSDMSKSHIAMLSHFRRISTSVSYVGVISDLNK